MVFCPLKLVKSGPAPTRGSACWATFSWKCWAWKLGNAWCEVTRHGMKLVICGIPRGLLRKVDSARCG